MVAEGTSDNRVEISRNTERLLEKDEFLLGWFSVGRGTEELVRFGALRFQCRTIGFRRINLRLVRHDSPVGRSRTLETPCGLQVGLVEAGEDIVTEVGLKLSVEVLAAIDLVDKRVQADTILPVFVKEEDASRVSLSDSQMARRQIDVMIPEDGSVHVHRFIVDHVLGDLNSTEVKEAVGSG